MYGFNFLGVNTKLPLATTGKDVDDLLKGASPELDTFKEVATALDEIKAKLGESGSITSEEVDKKIADAIAILTNNSSENFDTFKEISDWLNNDENKTAADIIKAINTLKTSKLDVITDLETISSNAAKGATALLSYEETDPIWTSDKDNYYTKTEADGKFLTEHQDITGKQDVIEDLETIIANANLGASALQSFTESDPVWTNEKSNYYSKTEADNKFLTEHLDISGKVDKEIIGSNGTAIIFNESDGGGSKFVHTDGLESYVGVNDGGADGLAAQIYADKLVDGKWLGAKIDVTNSGIYYTVGSDNFTTRAVLKNEIATKGFVSDSINRLIMKDMVENTCTKYVTVNTGYQVFVCGQNIEFRILDSTSKLMTATGLVSWIRHIISNGNAVGSDNSVDTNIVTMTCGETSQDFETSIQEEGATSSVVATDLLTFFATITGKTVTTMTLGDLVGKDITLNITDGTTSIDYRIFVNS